MKKIKILFADDHAIVRDGLRSLFKSDPGFEIVGEASDGAEAVKLVAKHNPDVAVLDISMPNVNGIEATSIIKARYPGTRVLILTIHENEEYIHELISAGADGYVLKNAQKKEIFDGVRAVANGAGYFSQGVSTTLVDSLVRNVRNKIPFQIAEESKLTERETEILRMIASGATSKEIGKKLHLKAATVKNYRTRMMKKLDIHDIVGLVKYAIQKSLIELSHE